MRERFAGAAEIRTEKRLRTKSVDPFPVSDVVDLFGQHFGPVVRANAAPGSTNGSARSEGEFLSVQVVC